MILIVNDIWLLLLEAPVSHFWSTDVFISIRRNFFPLLTLSYTANLGKMSKFSVCLWELILLIEQWFEITLFQKLLGYYSFTVKSIDSLWVDVWGFFSDQSVLVCMIKYMSLYINNTTFTCTTETGGYWVFRKWLWQLKNVLWVKWVFTFKRILLHWASRS
jgi:hypothetical protein